jgi:CO dehydrogenase maturation factor
MGYTIALSGKGGTGKTTLAGLLVRYLVKTGRKPVLAVDADSNFNLNEVLGVEVEDTLGEIREGIRTEVPSGMTKDVWMDIKVQQSLVEADGYDLIVMGRPEGSGCYCAANSILAGIIEKLVKNYGFLVVDNEAGMEHFSRLTTRHIDLLIVVTDPSKRGAQAACRINELVGELGLYVGKRLAVVNMAKNGVPDPIAKDLECFGDAGFAAIPADDTLADYDMEGRPTATLPEDNPAVTAAFELFEELLKDK